MILISHRRNLIEELKNTPKKYGVEIDIRTRGKDLIINHDPYKKGVLLKEWLEFYDHSLLILNVKEDGLEEELLDLLNKKKIKNYFFLDQAMPSLIKYALLGERKCAIRISEFESLETVNNFAGKLDWVWMDCFTKFIITKDMEERLHESNFKICLVSPELQGRNAEKEIPSTLSFLKQNKIEIDAVCTKKPDLWRELIE
tara:strand:+ start:307 stop:906 length:600 start_codon:yes stop_codon:yes gene_type:complete